MCAAVSSKIQTIDRENLVVNNFSPTANEFPHKVYMWKQQLPLRSQKGLKGLTGDLLHLCAFVVFKFCHCTEIVYSDQAVFGG